MAAGPSPTAKPRPKPTPSKPASPKPPRARSCQRRPAGQVVGRHELDRLAPEHTPAVELAPVRQHLAERDVVVGGRDEPAGARQVGVRAGHAVGELALHQAGRVGRAVLVAGGQPAAATPRGRRTRCRSCRAARRAPGAGTRRSAGPRGSRRGARRCRWTARSSSACPGWNFSGCCASRAVTLSSVWPRPSARRASANASSMGLSGNRLPGSPVVCIRTSRMFIGRCGLTRVTDPSSVHLAHLQGAPLGDVAVHRVEQLEHAPLVELHQGHRRDRLGHGVDAEDGVVGHRDGVLAVHQPEGAVSRRRGRLAPP